MHLPLSATIPLAAPILANIGGVDLVFLGGVFYLPVIAVVEGLILRFIYRWPWKRWLITALVANAISGAVGLPFTMQLRAAESALVATTESAIWTLYRFWIPIAAAIWFIYYLGTVLVESFYLHWRVRRVGPHSRYLRTLAVAALVNAVTYALPTSMWFGGMRPRLGDFRLVHRSQWLPDADEAFMYEHPEGSLWLGTTRGAQVARIAHLGDLPYTTRIGCRISDDGNTLFAVLVNEPEPWEPKLTSSGAPAATEYVFARLDLAVLGQRQRSSVLPGSAFATPDVPPMFERGSGESGHWRDGTLAVCHRVAAPLGSPLTIYPRVDATWRPDPAEPRWPYSVALKTAGSFVFKVSVDGMGRDCGSPHVLPGGRYVLFECSGEIMVLDVQEKKAVALFRGSEPVALASLVPAATQAGPFVPATNHGAAEEQEADRPD